MQIHLPDSRDQRGKRHDLAFVLTALLMALLRSTASLKVAALHRTMKRDFQQLCEQTGFKAPHCISDAQLRRLLHCLDYEQYNQVNLTYFGVIIAAQSQGWQAIDGKELRGTIDGVSGQKRAQNVVLATAPATRQSQVIGFYDGAKDSERTVVETYFKEQATLGGSYSLDALHLTPTLLKTIHQKKGTYLVQIKANQRHLLIECEHVAAHLPVIYADQQVDKGHGRLEIRQGRCYRLDVASLAPRWQASGLHTLVVVERQRTRLKDGHTSQERAYYVSNQAIGLLSSLVRAVRHHWQVETGNYLRDVLFGEDQLRCQASGRSRSLASLLTVGLNLLHRHNLPQNLTQLREELSQDWSQASACFAPN